MVEHLISFNSQEVIVRTDDVRVSDFVRETYEHMLTDSPREIVGEVTIVGEGGEFEVKRGGRPGLSASEPGALFPQIVDDVLQEFMDARPDFLWLHAGVAERDGSAVVIPASSGGGKSTVATVLVENGWHFMSDDIAPIVIGDLSVLSYPQLPRRRKFPGSRIADGRIGGLEREAVPVERGKVCYGPAELKTIIFPDFGPPEAPRISRLSRGAAAMKLIRNVRNFPDHREAAVKAVAEIVRAAELFQFDYNDPAQLRVFVRHKKEFGFFLAN